MAYDGEWMAQLKVAAGLSLVHDRSLLTIDNKSYAATTCCVPAVAVDLA